MAKTVVSSRSVGGLQIRRAEQYIEPGSFLELINAELEAGGTVGVRTGYESIIPPVDEINGESSQGIVFRDDELCIIKEGIVYSYSDLLGEWSKRGTSLPGRLRNVGIANSNSEPQEFDVAAVGPYLVFVWATGTVPGEYPVFFAVYDRTTLALIGSTFQLTSTGSSPRIEAAADWVMITWHERNSANPPGLQEQLYYDYWDVGSPTPTGTPILVASEVEVSRSLAATDQNSVLLAYTPTLLADSVVTERRRAVTLQTVVQSSGAGTLGDALLEIRFTKDNPAFAVYIGTTSGVPDVVRTRWLDSSLALLAEDAVNMAWNTSSIAPVAAIIDARDVHITYPNESAPFSNRGGGMQYLTATYDGAVSSLVIQSTVLGLVPAARPQFLRGRVLQPVTQPDLTGTLAFPFSDVRRSSLSSSHGVHDVSTQHLTGRTFVSGAGFASGTPALFDRTPPNSVLLGETLQFVGLYAREDSPVDLQGAIGQRAVLHSCDYSPRPVYGSTSRNSAHWAGCGFGYVYDGTTVSELDFHQTPSLADFVTAGGAIPAGTYSWALQWEWEDAQGKLYRSAPKSWTATLGGVSAVTIVVSTLHQTQRSGVRLLVGRTREAATGDPVFYRIDDPSAPTLNDPSAQSINFTDNNLDSTIVDNAALDQVGPGAITPNAPTPMTDFVAVASDRVWFGDPERPNAVRFSKPFREGFGVELGTDFAVLLDTSRRATGVAVQDRTFFGFTEASVHYWAGAGPNALNAGAAFAPPSLMPVPIGAIDQNTIQVTPYGIVYVSSKGPRIVARDRSSIAVFSPITEAWDFLGQETVATVFRFRKGDILFYDNGPSIPLESTAPKRLTIRHHFETNRATHDSGHQAIDAAVSEGGCSAFIRTDGRICIHDNGFTDGSSPVVTHGVTPWLRAGGTVTPLQTVREIQIVGLYLAKHFVTVRLLKNYAHEMWPVTRTFDPVVIMDPDRDGVRLPPEDWNDGANNSYLLRRQIAGARVQSLAVAWTITQVEEGAGASISAVEALFDDLGSGEFGPLDPRRVY